MFTGNTRSNQDILNYIIEQFIMNKVPPCMEGGGCYYPSQSPDQIGCAVGCLLPPDAAESWVDFDSITCIHSNYHENYEMFFNDDQLEFLNDLQEWHDSFLRERKDDGSATDYAVAKLGCISERYGLHLASLLP